MTQLLLVDVREKTPVTWGETKTVLVKGEKRQKPIEEVREWQWRKAIADRARSKYEKPSGISKLTEFTIDIVFFLMKEPLAKLDLDNLAKPVLDTLFKIRRSQLPVDFKATLTGVLFEVDDDRVCRLTLEKRLVSIKAQEGADITITWK